MPRAQSDSREARGPTFAQLPGVVPAHRPASSSQEAAARVLIGLYVVASLLALWAWAVKPRTLTRWTAIVFTNLNVPFTLSFVSVAVLGLVAGALVRRKRLALWAVFGFQLSGTLVSLASVAAHWAPAGSLPASLASALWSPREPSNVLLEIGGLLVSLFLAAAVWWLRPSFPARTAPAAWWRSSLAVVAGYALTLATVSFLIRGNRSVVDAQHPTWRVVDAAMREALGFNLTRDQQILAALGRIPLIAESLLSVTLVLSIWNFLRSVRPVGAWDGQTEVRVRSLLAAHGGDDSLGYFATRRDKSFVFSGDGRAVIAFRVVGSVCLASGDPVGDYRSWHAAVAEWLRMCRAYGWVPAGTSLSERGARALGEVGLGALILGDEAIVDPDRFTLDDTSMTPVRRAVNHARKKGLTLRVRYHDDLGDDEMSQIRRLADTWRVGGAERGFSMALGRLGDPADGKCVLVSAHDADGGPVALLSFVPWGRTGLSLDLMRRRPDAPTGVNEFMISGLMTAAGDLGISRVSLNFAVLRSTFAVAEEFGSSPIARASSSTLHLLDRFTQIESLYRNNDKYQPTWVPRYACIEAPIDFPRVAFAIGRAEGFIPTLSRPGESSHHLTAGELDDIRALRSPVIDLGGLTPLRGDQTRQRLRHLDELRAAGHDPYPVGITGATRLARIDPHLIGGLPGAGRPARITARVRGVRRHGGVVFIDLIDEFSSVQAIAERGRLAAGELRLLGRCLDVGDMIILDGRWGASRSGTRSLLVSEWAIIAKALHPIPYPRRGATESSIDVGSRLRHRSDDLLVHPGRLTLIRSRADALTALRATLAAEGYREVETPILSAVHGGANARPFHTWSNNYRTGLVLRIAPELQLKRLLVAGMGPLYEMGRSFRNEGADATHNPEFTSLEVYLPLGDYTDMRHLAERLVKNAARAVHGHEALPLVMRHELARHDGAPAARPPGLVDISGPWPVVTVCEAVSSTVGRAVDQHTGIETLLSLAREHDVAVADHMGPGAVLEELYGELVEPTTRYPTFYTDFPAETSPLAAPHRTEPGLSERWDLVIAGMELGTAYSELTDPIEQRRRLAEQSYRAAHGDLEAMEVDEDFLHALEIGMPPAGGLGIGIDRLLMAITGSMIRDVLAFPFARSTP